VSQKSFTFHSTALPVQGKLTSTIIREVVGGLPLRWRSLFLVKYQALLDTKRLAWVNVNCAEQVTRQLREGRKIIRIDLPCGRKKNAGDREGMYFTYFGRDAAESLTRYFNEIRGWPSPGQAIWVWQKEDYNPRSRSPNRDKISPLNRSAVSMKWVRLMRQTNNIPRQKGTGQGRVRYGVNLHEFRDVATTELHVKAKGKGLDMDCVKFWCGQVGQLDPLKYDKFFKDQNYVEKQYLIAEPFLNIESGTPPDEESGKRIQELEAKNTELSNGFGLILKKVEEADKASRENEVVVREFLAKLPNPERLKEMLDNYDTLEEFYHNTINQMAGKQGWTKQNVKREAVKK